MDTSPLGTPTSTQSLINAVLEKQATESQINTALLAKAQEIQQQQGANAVELIQAAAVPKAHLFDQQA